MRFMGDSYIKSEFRLTRSTDNALHILSFLTQWKMYLDQLETGLAPGSAESVSRYEGKRMNLETLNRMSTEQVGQLYELMHATRDVWKTSVASPLVSIDADSARPEQLEADAATATADDADPPPPKKA